MTPEVRAATPAGPHQTDHPRKGTAGPRLTLGPVRCRFNPPDTGRYRSSYRNSDRICADCCEVTPRSEIADCISTCCRLSSAVSIA